MNDRANQFAFYETWWFQIFCFNNFKTSSPNLYNIHTLQHFRYQNARNECLNRGRFIVCSLAGFKWSVLLLVRLLRGKRTTLQIASFRCIDRDRF